MAKNDFQRSIDRPKSRGSSTVVSLTGSGGGVDLTPYLLLDGSRAMTGSLSMGNFSITNVSLVDGVDVSAHVVDPNAHHGMLHDLDSTANHSGTLSWAKVNKAGSNLNEIVIRAHSVLQGIGPNDHHNQQHNIVGSDHTISSVQWGIVGATLDNVIGLIYPSVAPGATAKLLRTNTDGSLTIEKLTGTAWVKSSAYVEAATYMKAVTFVDSPVIQHTNSVTLSPTVDVVLDPGSNLVKLKNSKSFQTESFASGFAGSGFRLDQAVTTAGKTTLQLDDLWVRGTMHVYELLIQQIRATNGSIFVSSVGKVKTVSSLGGTSYRIQTDDQMAHGFLVNDLIRAQRVKWNGTQFAGVYQSNMQVTAVANLYQFDATLVSGNAPAVGYEFVRLGNTTNSARRGSIYLTADDASAPFIDIINDVDSFSDWNTAAVSKMRIGKLDGITGGSNEYGFIAGAGGYSDPVKYIKASNLGVRLNNVDLQLWNAGTQRVNIDNLGSNVWFKDASGNTKLSWNGSTLTVVGSITITGGSGYGALTDRPDSLADINSSESTKLTGIAAGATVGATWGTNLFGVPPRFGDAPGASGLYMTASNMGFYNGTAWKLWFDNTGYFYFGGSTGKSLRWDGTKLGGYDASNVLQWAAGDLGGFVGFSAGIYSNFAYTRLDASGLRIYFPTWEDDSGTPEPGYGTEPNTDPSAWTTIEFLDTPTYWTHNYPAQVYSGTYEGGTFFKVFGSSKHLVPIAEEYGSWAHYYDGVLQVESPGLSGFGGGEITRLWLNAARVYVSNNLYVGGNIYATNKILEIKDINIKGTGGLNIYDRDGTGTPVQVYNSGDRLRIYNSTYDDRWVLYHNGDLIHTGTYTLSGSMRVGNSFYNTTGYSGSNYAFRFMNESFSAYQSIVCGTVYLGTAGSYINSGSFDWTIKQNDTTRIGVNSWGVYIYGALTMDGVFSLQTVYTSANKPIAPSTGIKIYLYNDAGTIKLAGRFAGSADHKFILNP